MTEPNLLMNCLHSFEPRQWFQYLFDGSTTYQTTGLSSTTGLTFNQPRKENFVVVAGAEAQRMDLNYTEGRLSRLPEGVVVAVVVVMMMVMMVMMLMMLMLLMLLMMLMLVLLLPLLLLQLLLPLPLPLPLLMMMMIMMMMVMMMMMMSFLV